MPLKGNEKENYRCITEIMNVAVNKGLREIFKQEWDKHYGKTKGVWDDTCISGNELYNMEKGRPGAKQYLHLFRAGKRSDLDISALSDAILYSNALKMHLAPHILNEVKELRDLRNTLMHSFASKDEISDAAFENAYKKVENCFNVLLLSTADVEQIRNLRKGKSSTWSSNVVYICFTIYIVGLFYWVTKSNEATLLFPRILPTRGPVHLFASTVNKILESLDNLSVRNNRSLTYCYISGNPGSGKSLIARLVGQRYGTNIPKSWFPSSASVFVMTLNGRSLNNILESYVDFADLLGCDKNSIESIIYSSKTTTAMQIQCLVTEIAKKLRNFKGKWLLIIDNVVKLGKISSFLPQLEDEDWNGGQVLITTQDKSSVPPSSSLIAHFSVSHTMDPAEYCDIFTDQSAFDENQDLIIQ